MQVFCFRDKAGIKREQSTSSFLNHFRDQNLVIFFRHSRNFNSPKLASQNLLPLRDGVSGLERIIQQQKLFDQVYRYLFAFFSTLTSI